MIDPFEKQMAEKKVTILDNGEGLFNTHVVLEDVQQVIGEQMNTKARLGENTKYTVVGDGNVSYHFLYKLFEIS